MRTVEWKDGKVIMVDQTKLPNKLVFAEYNKYEQIADAISTLVVRGAPAIGVSGAFGMALAAQQSNADSKDSIIADLEIAKDILQKTRPTAINLKWGLEKIMDAAHLAKDDAQSVRDLVVLKAKQMAEDDISINMKIGKNGAVLFGQKDTVMTHCNAGALATVAYGTALGVIRAVRDGGKEIKVIATETRPVQQGSRLTTFELQHDGFDVSLVPDTAVGYVMSQGMIDRVIVGADRILRTGHVYNKIGTYQVATMAKQHGIPFYVAAPLSTFDMHSRPKDVIIEQRKGDEVTRIGDKKMAPDGIGIINPAFDMTPPDLVSSIITEAGIANPPYEESICNLFEHQSTN
ncbi:MAG: S-methyl-5-thioribose-1-phosphate isomerase [Cenarchaeum symbiont of Oopsacas minuta]|nr:S-methyl-5-thioribose-1-phosphate isomerase [Cenarchaeum symbiont of Oopsacas minuta]